MTEAQLEVLRNEVRVYKTPMLGYVLSMEHLDNEGRCVRRLGKEGKYFYFAACNIFEKKVKTGLAQVSAKMKMPMPEDIDLYYRVCGPDYMVMRHEYNFLPVSTIASGSFSIGGDPPIRKPRALIRFCSIVDFSFFALRTNNGGKTWEVCHVWQYDHVTEEAAYEDAETTDGSFTEWLARMRKTDGWPVGRCVVPDTYHVKASRVPDSVARDKFGADAFERNKWPTTDRNSWPEI